MAHILNTIQIFTTFSLLGLIWMVQLVHYPTFLYIEDSDFIAFHQRHSKMISLIVVPLMTAELLSSCGLLFCKTNHSSGIQMILVLIVLSIWVSTFLIQLPIHRQLTNQKDQKAIRKLIKTNWIRTFLWTVKGIFVLILLIIPSDIKII